MRWILLLFLLRHFCDADADQNDDFMSPDSATNREKNRYEKFVDDVITKGVTDLGFNVHRSAKNLNPNNDNYIVYSPVSIAAALYMLMLGAHGNTFTELSKILGLSWGLNIENHSEQIHEAFGELLRSLEGSATDGSLVKFANGLFVQNDFSLRQTFYPNGKSQPSRLQFPMMANGAKYLYHNDSVLSCEIVGLPYKGHEYTMYFIIPHDSNKEQLEHLESRVTYSEVKRLTSNARGKDILVVIPKMKLTTNLELRDILEDNGLRTLFDPLESNLGLLLSSNNEDDETNPNRRRKRQNVNSNNRYQNSLDTIRHILNEKQNSAHTELFLNQVLHKVVVDVNEKGTEAAAATAATLEKSSRVVVKANVPFLFFIQHEASDLILFWGSVITPSPFKILDFVLYYQQTEFFPQ